MHNTIILGGGIAGLSLASFLNGKSTVLEKQDVVGGLSRSYQFDGINYDIGPHIIFSKNREIMKLHTSMIETTQIRRSNQILYKGRLVKYPFENDLGKLPEDDRDWCLQEFLHNPYENYQPNNMLQFFLKTFGEGITQAYLQPYNQKIWKFDPSCMDVQMVERIPKPPKEDVIASANGVETEGYTHQLYFHYPSSGGFQTLVDAYEKSASRKSEVKTGIHIHSITKEIDEWVVHTDCGNVRGDCLVNCMPLHELFEIMVAPMAVRAALDGLLYNSIYIVLLHVRRDTIGNHFALYIPDPEVIFHRLSKLNFLGDNYCREGGASTLMAEVTFRPMSYLSTLDRVAVEQRVVEDLVKLGFINRADVACVETRVEKYAYVIYDLHHRKNADLVLDYLRSLGIESAGRFAEFEYLNSDGVVEHTLRLAERLNQLV
ncbi:MAG: protoporphyrinogen/coproporphyrinogen oxidase [Acidiferrobacterales bacterium]